MFEYKIITIEKFSYEIVEKYVYLFLFQRHLYYIRTIKLLIELRVKGIREYFLDVIKRGIALYNSFRCIGLIKLYKFVVSNNINTNRENKLFRKTQ